jgi:hypothetical protein
VAEFLYVLPCAYEDLVKLGISRQPLQRVRAYSSRWFEFFDLDHALLLEADDRREVQAWETRLKRELKLSRAPAPLLVERLAAGHSEWFRGSHADITAFMQAQAGQGYRLHVPARDWLRQALAADNDRLYSWSDATLQSMEELGDCPASKALQQSLRDACDAQLAMGLPLAERVPQSVLAWHRDTPRL